METPEPCRAWNGETVPPFTPPSLRNATGSVPRAPSGCPGSLPVNGRVERLASVLVLMKFIVVVALGSAASAPHPIGAFYPICRLAGSGLIVHLLTVRPRLVPGSRHRDRNLMIGCRIDDHRRNARLSGPIWPSSLLRSFPFDLSRWMACRF